MVATVPPGSCFYPKGLIGADRYGDDLLGKTAACCGDVGCGYACLQALPRPAQPKTHRRPAPRARLVPVAPSQKRRAKNRKRSVDKKRLMPRAPNKFSRHSSNRNTCKASRRGSGMTTTQAALRKYQADHGWQSKTVPDSRALIKLGLGPSKEGLLNPETAMTSASEHPATSAKPTEAEASGKSSPR